MRITRRSFLKYLAGAAATLGLSPADIFRIENVLAGELSPPVIWLQASSCSGCSVSFLNWLDSSTTPESDAATLLQEKISLKYHPTLMAATGKMAVKAAEDALLPGQYILVVEGAVPTTDNGIYCQVWEKNGVPVTALQAVREFSTNALEVLAVGCAAYGGIPGALPNPAGARGVRDVISRAPINLPGCPVHPEWIVGTIAQLILGNPLALDTSRRPRMFYGSKIHTSCPRRGSAKVPELGMVGCQANLDCRGPETYADCHRSSWNKGTSGVGTWCIGVNFPCIGCTQVSFPDGTLPSFA